MTQHTEKLLLLAGFITIVLLTFVIEKRVCKQLDAKISVFTYVVVGLVCSYYLFDVIFHVELFYQDIYFYFWLAILIVQIIIFLLRWNALSTKNHHTQRE